MVAYAILRSNKTSIVETLVADYRLILNKAEQNKLITRREYNNLKSINKLDDESHVVALVDKIMNKGEEKCQAFLKLLQTDEDIQETYPELQNILKKENLLPHPVQASSVDDTDNQPQRREEDGQYELNSQPTGLCLIINNKHFSDGDVRRGTDKDAGSLAEVFSRLGFRVLMCKDQTKDQMKRALECFASQRGLSQLQEFRVKVKEWTRSRFTDLLEAPQHGDAFICCVLSHGSKGGVLGTDGRSLPIEQITRTFRATDQSPLTAKPKVFLIQASQGHQIHPGMLSDGEQADGSDSTSIPEEADFLVHSFTVEDYPMRDPTEGSWFIQSVCEQLEEGCQRNEEIEVILRRVNNEVAGKEGVFSCGPVKQMPEIRHTLRKGLVLTPNYNSDNWTSNLSNVYLTEVSVGSGANPTWNDSTRNITLNPEVFPTELKTEWRTALSSILDELTDFEFIKLLFNLEKIPEGLKEGRVRGDMPNVIIQYYGTEGSISLIDRLMNELSRLDNAVQQPLREIKELKKLKEDILRDQLIRHVTDVGSVLDELFTKGAIHQESYDHICTLPTSEEKMKELLDVHLKSEEDKDILYKIAEKWIPLAEGPRLASQSESVISRGSQKVVLAEVQTVGQVPEVPWITLKPEVICGDDEDTPIYSLESDAGRFECGLSGLRWVCKGKVSLKYQFVSWEEHMERMDALHFSPGGPLLNVTVIAGELEEAYLPHWICTEDNPEVLGKFSVLHIDACGDVVEPVSEVTPSHVKLSQPHFSSIGVLIAKTGFPININCKVLIFKTNMTFLTLHVYLIPKDPDLQQKIKSKKSSGYEMIEKPCSLSLKMGNHFHLNANMDGAEIYPVNLKLEYEGSDPNFYEVFIENPDSNFELTLTHESAPVWTCRIRKDDYTNTGDIQGMRAATSQQTDSGAAPKKKPAADNQPHMRDKMEQDKLETKWRTVLSSILDELTEVEFKKLGSSLEKIPQGVKERRLPGDMIHLIIQYYGTEGSIQVIDCLMRNLPRLDNKVQQPLRDIKDELKKFKEQNQGSPDEDDMK